jgi:hypothetical protein
MSIKLASSGNVQLLDTKANLLYKVGRRDEAISSEESALEEDNLNARRRGQDKGAYFDEYTATIAKMKKGEPTWPQN